VTELFKPLLKPLASLRLTVALMAASIVLIFASTWAQIDRGILTVVGQFFRDYVVWIDLQIFFPRSWDVPGRFPWPGGYSLGAALVANLLAAHTVRFKLSWKRSGIFMIHAALLLFLLGEWIYGEFALETQMPIYEGQTVQWAQDIREAELAVVDRNPPDGRPDHDRVVVVTAKGLDGAAKNGRFIRHDALPFDIKVENYFENSQIYQILDQGNNSSPQATRVFENRVFSVRKAREVAGVDGGGVNLPAAIVTLKQDGEDLGTYPVSIHFQSDVHRYDPQTVVVSGRPYDIFLRFRRY